MNAAFSSMRALGAAALCVLVSLSIGSAPMAQEAEEAPPTDLASLENFVDGYVAAKTVDLEPPAMSVAVVTPQGTIAKGYGIADMDTGTKADGDTLFRIGSISKLFVWLSAHMLADEGKLDLDADVNTYFEGFAIPEAYGKPVTMRDLMGHRPGFEDNLRDFIDPNRDISLRDAVAREIPERVAPPGERASYSNTGTNMGAYIVERASGMDYYDFVRRRILEPAGMNATTLHDPGTGKNPAALDARMAKPHEMEGGTAAVAGYMPIRPQEPVGAVGMSARDAAIFMRLLLDETQLENGDRLLSETAWQRLASRAFPDGTSGDDMGWGFMTNSVDGAETLGHGGATKFLSWMFVIPERDVGVFVSSNMVTPETRGEDVAWSIARRIAGTDAAGNFAALEGDVEAAEEVAGTYVNNRRPFRGTAALFNVGTETSVSAKDGFLVVGESRYAPLAKDLWIALDGRRLRTVRGEDGEILRLHGGLGSATLERVGFMQSSYPLLIAVGLCLFLSITTLFGMWYRSGRRNGTTEKGRRVMWIALVSALLWLAFAVTAAVFAISVSDIDLATIDEDGFPPIWLRILLLLLVVLTVQAVIHLISIVFAWRGSGWGLWRKLHFTVFGIAFAYAMFAFAKMGVIGSSLYGL